MIQTNVNLIKLFINKENFYKQKQSSVWLQVTGLCSLFYKLSCDNQIFFLKGSNKLLYQHYVTHTPAQDRP